jgi:hypothetical protein
MPRFCCLIFSTIFVCAAAGLSLPFGLKSEELLSTAKRALTAALECPLPNRGTIKYRQFQSFTGTTNLFRLNYQFEMLRDPPQPPHTVPTHEKTSTNISFKYVEIEDVVLSTDSEGVSLLEFKCLQGRQCITEEYWDQLCFLHKGKRMCDDQNRTDKLSTTLVRVCDLDAAEVAKKSLEVLARK